MSREQELRDLPNKWEKEADAIPQAWANEARVYRGCAVQLREILAQQEAAEPQPEKLAVTEQQDKPEYWVFTLDEVREAIEHEVDGHSYAGPKYWSKQICDYLCDFQKRLAAKGGRG